MSHLLCRSTLAARFLPSSLTATSTLIRFKPFSPSSPPPRVPRMSTEAAASSSSSPSPSSAIDFLTLCRRLKTTKRAGWVLRDVQGPESIADHMYRMGVMALISADLPGVDRDKCVKMAIVHDIAEAIVGDITPSDGISKAEKSRREREAIEDMCKLLGGGPRAKEIKDLWLEYEECSSLEAKVVKDFDKIEMILQALEYEKEQGKDLDEFFQSTAGLNVHLWPPLLHASKSSDFCIFRRRNHNQIHLSSTAMASRRSLLSSLHRTSLYCAGFQQEFLGSSSWKYSTIASSKQRLLKIEDQQKKLANESDPTFECDISEIREQFNAAKQRFLKIPDALKDMPKANPKGIYANKNLRLDNIKVYGFDYDYTLAHYSSNLQTLIYDLAKQHLVNEFKYPESCMEFKYDPSFPIRGLYYDKVKGCLMKLDFFGSIEPGSCYFGRRKLSHEEIDEIYGTRHIGRDQAGKLVCLMDFFCFSEACLIADIVQHFVDAKLEFDAGYIYEDVNRAIQHVHKSHSVHKGILSDPQKYLVKNGQLLSFLRKLKDKGKKLFLLTNSPFFFVDGGMRFMLEDSLAQQDSWRELFDVVIAKAKKPDFYTSEHPFRCYDVEKDTLEFSKVDSLLPDKVYYHGCLKTFLQITKWKGPEVIYFGDHLFSDLRGPSKAGWHTAAIIHELENEISIQNDDSYRFGQAKFHIIQELLGKLHAKVVNCQISDAYKSLLWELNDERQKARYTMKEMFNRSFGATFLTDSGQESAFAYHIHQYADVYTSKPENFFFYLPEAWLHVPYDIKILPHHVKVSSDLFKT